MLKGKLIGAVIALSAAMGLLFASQPGLEDRLKEMEPLLDRKLAQRKVQIDPGELLDLIYNLNLRLKIMDVRDENEFNLFHIIDAERITMEQIGDLQWVRKLPTETVFVLVSNDESRAARAWKLLRVQGVKNLYLLAGGINGWLRAYGRKDRLLSASSYDAKEECRKYVFEAALGSRHPESDPDPKNTILRKYEKKVKEIGRKVRRKGGCS